MAKRVSLDITELLLINSLLGNYINSMTRVVDELINDDTKKSCVEALEEHERLRVRISNIIKNYWR